MKKSAILIVSLLCVSSLALAFNRNAPQVNLPNNQQQNSPNNGPNNQQYNSSANGPNEQQNNSSQQQDMFAQVKAIKIEGLQQRIKINQDLLSCVQSAQTRGDMMNCEDKTKQAMDDLMNEQRQKMDSLRGDQQQ